MPSLVFTAPSSAPSPLMAQEVGVVFTVALDEAWGVTYQTPVWSVFGPEGSTAIATGLLPGTGTVAQSMTTDIPGNYLVSCVVELVSDPTTTLTLSTLYSVSPSEVHSGLLPAPYEQNQVNALGWAVGLSRFVKETAVKTNGVHLTIINKSGSTLSANTFATVDFAEQLHGWGGGATARDTGEYIPRAIAIDATTSGIALYPLGFVTSDILDGAIGTIVMSGFIPFDTTALGSSTGDPLYIDDSGVISTAPGTEYRVIGVAGSSGTATGTTVGFVALGNDLAYNSPLVMTEPADGDVLIFDDSSKTWIPGSAGGATRQLMATFTSTKSFGATANQIVGTPSLYWAKRPGITDVTVSTARKWSVSNAGPAVIEFRAQDSTTVIYSHALDPGGYPGDSDYHLSETTFDAALLTDDVGEVWFKGNGAAGAYTVRNLIIEGA